MRTDWKSLSPEAFESLCARLLELNGFVNVVWHGAVGGDRGRDLTAERQLQLLNGVNQVTRWVVQCKRYTVRPPTKTEIHDWLVSSREHKPDYALFITTSTLTSNTKDWLTGTSGEFPYKVLLWEKRDLDRELSIRRGELVDQFPQLYHGDQPVLDLHPVEPSTFTFVFSELGITLTAHNCDDEEEAERNIRSFLELVRNHSINFNTGRQASEEK